MIGRTDNAGFAIRVCRRPSVSRIDHRGGPVLLVVLWKGTNPVNSLIVLYATAALMAFVGAVCAVLCVAWSIPSWRRRLARNAVVPKALGCPVAGGLTGWPARVGSALVSTGIASCAVVGWYGCYCVLASLIVGSW